MMRFAALMFAFALMACEAPTRPRIYDGPDVDAIRTADEAINAAIIARNGEAVLAHYEPGGLIVEWLRVEEQRIGPQGSFEQLLSDPNSALAYGYAHVEVSQSRDMASSDGECTITRTNPATSQPESYRGACMKLWRRGEDDQWRIAREMRAPIHNRN